MVAIKDMAEMPKGCWYSTDLKLSGITTCPLKDYCSRKHIKEAPLDKRPKDCPLVEIGTCKDCKHWKDSDGVYRRGVGAESKCPINIKEVYEGNFYCKDFDKRGSENEIN